MSMKKIMKHFLSMENIFVGTRRLHFFVCIGTNYWTYLLQEWCVYWNRDIVDSKNFSCPCIFVLWISNVVPNKQHFNQLIHALTSHLHVFVRVGSTFRDLHFKALSIYSKLRICRPASVLGDSIPKRGKETTRKLVVRRPVGNSSPWDSETGETPFRFSTGF